MELDELGFPKFEDVVKNVGLSQYALGDPRRLDLLVKYMDEMHEGYLKSLGWWGRLKRKGRRFWRWRR